MDVSLRLLERPERLASIADPQAAAKGGHYVWVRPDPEDLAALAALADRGELAVHVDQALPLAEAAQAWRLNRLGRTRGKLVLSVGER
ncbi:zinc-binding dehydrogenase [Streptomyces avermitilis]|uniref:zinc-binding dehydrogenase n=1 Tax=Streptomyces avermitilis TaxID=33903 RepID=UPI0036995F30